MSVKAVNWAWNQDLKPTPMVVLQRLADFAGQDGKCYASYYRLTTDCNVSKNTIIKTLRELVEWGYITKIKNKHANQSNASNSFILNLHIPYIDFACSVSEPALVQAAEPALVQTVEPAKKLTIKQKKEKKKKKTSAKAFDPPIYSYTITNRERYWIPMYKQQTYEPHVPQGHKTNCNCNYCQHNRLWHEIHLNTKQQSSG